MYKIEITEKPRKFLKKLPTQDVEMILNKINDLKENPFRYLKKLEGYKLWRLRIEKYRAIINVVVSNNKIIVLKIGYRKNVYDKI